VNIWISGTFGVGKTTTAAQLEAESTHRIFDPEHVGYMLQANLSDFIRAHDIFDFQDLAPWRTLVPQVARSVSDLTGAELIIVQTVLVEEYWNEMRVGMDRLGLPVLHVLLDAEESVMRHRIESDEVEVQARGWRLQYLESYRVARKWMTARADVVVDTTFLSPAQVASAIVEAIG
jgi:broad-specificity NMP kinase